MNVHYSVRVCSHICVNNNNSFYYYMITVDMVIFACSNFREFLILGLCTKFENREFLFFFRSVIIIIIFARFLNSRIYHPREIREN